MNPMIRTTLRSISKTLSVTLALGLMLAAGRSNAQFPVNSTLGHISGYQTVSGSSALQFFENYDTNGDGISDNRFYLWTSTRGTLQSNVDHLTAVYNSLTHSVKVGGLGKWGLTPCYVSITVVPYSSLYPGIYRMTVVSYKVDAGGNILYDVLGNPLVLYPSTTYYPRLDLYTP